jgi:hypothetical protein
MRCQAGRRARTVCWPDPTCGRLRAYTRGLLRIRHQAVTATAYNELVTGRE